MTAKLQRYFSATFPAIIISLVLLSVPKLANALEFSATNPADLPPGNSASIGVEGGCPPYTWSVSANGMNFSDSFTQSSSTTLIAGSDACGTAHVAVKDSCGSQISTEVRSTSGNYDYLLLETCGAMDGWHQSSGIVDGYRYVVDHYNCNSPDTHHGDPCPNHPCLGCSTYYCPEGSEKWGWGCVGETLVITPKDVKLGKETDSPFCPIGKVGNPVSIFNGNNFEEAEDLRFNSPFRRQLTFKRFYNSQSQNAGVLGHGWRHNYQLILTPPCLQIGEQCHLKIEDETGRGVYFKEGSPDIWEGAFGEFTRVVQSTQGYDWRRENGLLYHFALSGQLEWIEDEAGNRQMLIFDLNGRLQNIHDQANDRVLTLHYDSYDRVDYITGPVDPAVTGGIWVNYNYDSQDNLVAVNYADDSGFNYIYSDPADPHNLTEKRNMPGHFISSWTYDAMDRVRENSTRDGKGVRINYNSDKKVTLTDAYGITRIYQISLINGVKRVTGITRAGGCGTCIEEPVRVDYDSAGHVSEVEYANGLITRYADYNVRGYPREVNTAAGTPEERTVNYTYHPILNVKLSRQEPSLIGHGFKTTTWDYDADGNSVSNENPTMLLRRKVEQGYTRDERNVIPFEDITTYIFNSYGMVISIDGQLPGSQDTVLFTYNSENGDLASVTYPEAGTVDYDDYTESGRVGRTTDPNNNTVTYEYDGRGRVTKVTHLFDNSTTRYAFNPAGKISNILAPNGVSHDFYYDPVFGRLEKIVDKLGNYITRAYDDQGNLIEQSYYDSADVRTYWKRFNHQNPENPGRLWKEISPDDTFKEYLYDAVGNLTSVKDESDKITTYEYDVNRQMSGIIEPGDLLTAFSFDKHGNPDAVTDAEDHLTQYVFDDLGMVIRRLSPDTGNTSYSYDASDNLLYKRDANSNFFTYLYDDASRLTAIRFPTVDDDVVLTYDEGANGQGRLTGMRDASGSYVYGYDTRGNVTFSTATVEGVSYSTGYTYDAASVLTAMAYPDGRTVTYELDPAGRVAKVVTGKATETVTLADNIGYYPFGPVSQMTYGNGVGWYRAYDLNYRLQSITAGGFQNLTYSYHPEGNLKAIADNLEITRNQLFFYDNLYRLEDAEGIYGQLNFTYDNVGNRLSQTLNGLTDYYSYEPGTSRLTEITGIDSEIFSHDAGGNLIATNKAIQNQNGDMIVTYTYNGNGQRIKKETIDETTVYHYDLYGNLIGESTLSGEFKALYIYLNNIRLAAVIKEGSEEKIYFYLNDHLGTPQKIIDENGQVVWWADYSPFGEVNVNLDLLVNNFRFAGQYFDAETGLHYNYHRYYDPKTGRYLTPDPIGLLGGINLFIYAGNNPVNFIDPWGLETVKIISNNNLITLNDQENQDFRATISKLPDNSISSMTIYGHGIREGIHIGKKTGITYIPWAGVSYSDTGESFSDSIRSKLTKDAKIFLRGCNTARENYLLKNVGDDHITKKLSEELHGITITGYRGFGASNEVSNPFNRDQVYFRVGREMRNIGLTRTYLNGQVQ